MFSASCSYFLKDSLEGGNVPKAVQAPHATEGTCLSSGLFGGPPMKATSPPEAGVGGCRGT